MRSRVNGNFLSLALESRETAALARGAWELTRRDYASSEIDRSAKYEWRLHGSALITRIDAARLYIRLSLGEVSRDLTRPFGHIRRAIVLRLLSAVPDVALNCLKACQNATRSDEDGVIWDLPIPKCSRRPCTIFSQIPIGRWKNLLDTKPTAVSHDSLTS